MKNSRLLAIFIVALMLVCGKAADSDSRDDQNLPSRFETNELLDREKLLLDKQEKLASHAHELKQAINKLSTDLSYTQKDLNDVRRELIILHVKLLP